MICPQVNSFDYGKSLVIGEFEDEFLHLFEARLTLNEGLPVNGNLL